MNGKLTSKQDWVILLDLLMKSLLDGYRKKKIVKCKKELRQPSLTGEQELFRLAHPLQEVQPEVEVLEGTKVKPRRRPKELKIVLSCRTTFVYLVKGQSQINAEAGHIQNLPYIKF